MKPSRITRTTGFPAIIRPSFTLGGSGGGIAYNIEDFRDIVEHGLDISPTHQVLVEESLLGWKEFELEVMRDKADNVVIICSIENIDPMGVHTGDSITVAPAQTLTDREYQRLRDMATKVMNAVGVETGGSNVQFAVNPRDGRVIVIEMNPRVSRSSALASKATGFPIAKIAAKLAVGYTLDELPNDITRETPASFEPTLDYVVVKAPRWAFEKFPGAEATLGTQMKSVGEAMAIGRTFAEAWQKAFRSLEIGRMGWGADGRERIDAERLRERLITPHPERPFYVRYALQSGMEEATVARLTGYDPWFVHEMVEILNLEGRCAPSRLRRCRPVCCAMPSARASAMSNWSNYPGRDCRTTKARYARCASSVASARPIIASIPARPSSRPLRPICTRRMRPRANPSRPTARR